MARGLRAAAWQAGVADRAIAHFNRSAVACGIETWALRVTSRGGARQTGAHPLGGHAVR